MHTHLAGGLTDEQVNELVAFWRKVTEELDKAGSDFALRKRIIEYLNTRVMFAVEAGEQVAYLHCEFGYVTRLTKDSLVNRDENLSPPPESFLSASSPAAEGGRSSTLFMRKNFFHVTRYR